LWIKTFLYILFLPFFLLSRPSTATAAPLLKRHCFAATQDVSQPPHLSSRPPLFRAVLLVSVAFFSRSLIRSSRSSASREIIFLLRTGETRKVSEIGQMSAFAKRRPLNKNGTRDEGIDVTTASRTIARAYVTYIEFLVRWISTRFVSAEKGGKKIYAIVFPTEDYFLVFSPFSFARACPPGES